jgi:soluble P-type ATPase
LHLKNKPFFLWKKDGILPIAETVPTEHSGWSCDSEQDKRKIYGGLRMIEVEIPGAGLFQFQHLVLDVNGTIAEDGKLIPGVAENLQELGKNLSIHLITADTYGTQENINQSLHLKAARVPRHNQAQAKLEYIEELGTSSVVAIGNGANDAAMLEHAALGIAVIGPEGAAIESLLRAKVVVGDILKALELLLHTKRLIATLRR